MHPELFRLVDVDITSITETTAIATPIFTVPYPEMPEGFALSTFATIGEPGCPAEDFDPVFDFATILPGYGIDPINLVIGDGDNGRFQGLQFVLKNPDDESVYQVLYKCVEYA